MKLVLNKGQKLFFTSDTHYNHANICSATTEWIPRGRNTREFNSLSHMNNTLVNNINEVVGEDDILIHLGDWSFGGVDFIAEFRDRIICKNIHLVYGNHDHHQQNNRGDIQNLFSSCHDYLELEIRRPANDGRVNKYTFACFHYPIASWKDMNNGVIHLHGHVHLPPNQRIAEGKAMDVGVDGNGLKPISMDDVLKIMSKQPIKKLSLPSDHHEEKRLK
jgi:calcineurin-like phosphoesterase family protein